MANRFLNNIRINDEYTLPSQDGTADQIIATDGAGNLSFVDAAVTSADSNLVYYDVKNSSGATINKGKAVRAVGTDGNSGHILIDEMVADGSIESKYFIGVLETTLDNGDIGRVFHFGELDQFNTLGQNGETWNNGDILWLDPSNNGDYTITEPNGPNLKVAAAIIKNVATNGKIHVRVQANEGVHDLHDVTLGALGEGDLLTYDSSLQVWKDSGQSTTAAQMPSGTTAERPTGVNGMLRYNTDDNQFEGYANSTWGAIAGSGGGSGGGELLIERDVFTATALQTAFTISSAITASSNTQVYIDGVYQAKSNYTTSGSTITFSTGVPAGAEVEVVHFISVLSKVYTDTFTGDASTVNFTASKDVTDENVTQVYIDGVYQSKDNYTTSGTTITFSTAPPSGSAIEVVHFTPAVYSTLNSNQFTGTGLQTDFTLTQAVEEDKSFVFIQGIYQEKSTYSISGTTLIFTTAPQSGYTVEVITVGEVSMLPDTIDIDNFSGTGSQVDFVLTSTPSTENAIDVYINGLYQQKDTFSLSGNTLTFSTAPPNGSTIEVKHQFVASVKGEVALTAGTGISITKNSNNNFTIENTLIDVTVSYNTPTGQSLTYTTPSSSIGQAGSIYGPQTFTITDGSNTLSGTASISGLPNGLTASQSYNNSDPGNILTITLGGVFPSANSLNTNLTISGLTSTTPPLEVDYLVIAGGGGGGRGRSATGAGAGGGAGGYRNSYNSETSGGGVPTESLLTLLRATNYTVTVGAGGGGAGGSTNGANGSNSVFATITSTGGGGGATGPTAGSSGGSGGGGASGAGGAAVTSPVVQGYRGGNQSGASPGAGGGGAGATGQDINTGNYAAGGNGGNGLTSSITGAAIARAGGGGGGGYSSGSGAAAATSGGTGGGGNGGGSSSTAGTANTGSGGGGGNGGDSVSRNGASGGSGVVIIRYPSGYTITIGAGLTGTTTTDGSDKVTTFTAGTGNISFS